ncbi:hypothetical protein MVEN_00505500 [Mycena venus]|uniref:Uncharacterized protein n=1 Tax=Mycena venus TaxID=2733690 RepID=A0A8H6YM92_9AGAR|nr:hypothetical protein MVEN_00505500 [Mycena venus]
MSRETPNDHTSFIRKSLARIAHVNPNPVHTPAIPSMRKPVLQSHRIFNVSLSSFKTSSPPRLGPKTHNHTTIDPDTSTSSVAEDNSMSSEQDSLDTDNSATDTDLPSTAAPPGLPCPSRYPIIRFPINTVVPRPGVRRPAHWAPARAGCDVVRIEHPKKRAEPLPKPLLSEIPPPPQRFQPRPGSSVSSGQDQDDDTFYTISTSISATSGNDDAMEPPRKDLIHAQLEHILEMDDGLIDDADLPGVPQSLWATCPTPPPSPSCSLPAQRLNRKASHALLNYLLLECGYDLASLRSLEARLPVSGSKSEHVSEVVEEYTNPDTSNTADDLQIPNGNVVAEGILVDLDEETSPTVDALDESGVSLEEIVSILEELFQPLESEAKKGHETEETPPTIGALDGSVVSEATESVLEQVTYTPDVEVKDGHKTESGTLTAMKSAQSLAPEVAKRRGPETARSIEGLSLGSPFAFISRSKARLDKANAAPSFDGPPLTRIRSLPECWRMSAFTAFAHSPPPSPTPAPKAKPKAKMYMHAGPMITSVEELATPLQSGHAYLRANKMMAMKNKVKTRPADAVVRPESPIQHVPGVPLQRTMTGGSLVKTSLLGRFRHTPKWSSVWSKLTKPAVKGMRVLVKGGNAREMSWKDFCMTMRELGFTMTESGGNSVKFTPPFDNAPTITFRRPHDKVLRMRQLGKVRKALVETYGWAPEDIMAVLGTD